MHRTPPSWGCLYIYVQEEVDNKTLEPHFHYCREIKLLIGFQTQSDQTQKHTNNKGTHACGGSGSDDLIMQIRGRRLHRLLWMRISDLHSIRNVNLWLCLGHDWLEKQQHPTDRTDDWCWVPHGRGWKTCWYTGAKRWAVPSQQQPLHNEHFNCMKHTKLFSVRLPVFVIQLEQCFFNKGLPIGWTTCNAIGKKKHSANICCYWKCCVCLPGKCNFTLIITSFRKNLFNMFLNPLGTFKNDSEIRGWSSVKRF